MNGWMPAIGKWNDIDNYDIKEPQWVLALKYAKDKYDSAEVYWEYKEGDEKKRVPYIMFVQNVLNILIKEAHISDYHLLSLAALARVGELTGCSSDEIEVIYSGCVEEISDFPEKKTDNIIEYYAQAFDGKYKNTTLVILLAELLFVLRQEKYHFADWEEDVKCYLEIEKIIDAFSVKMSDERVCFLCKKIKEQLESNGDISRDGNKNPEELYAGWYE